MDGTERPDESEHTPQEKTTRRKPEERHGRLILIRLAILTVVLVLYIISKGYWWEYELTVGLKVLAERMYVYFPVVAGVTAGLSHRAPFRYLVGLLVGVLFIMALLDQAPPVRAFLGPADINLNQQTAELEPSYPPELNLREVPSDRQSHALRRAWRWLSGEYEGWQEVPPTLSYPADNPRWIVQATTYRLTFLLRVPIIMGIVLGLTTWIEKRVFFREPRDETVAFVVLSWLVSPALWSVAEDLTVQPNYEILVLGASPMAYVYPLTLLAGLALVGWWVTARRRS